jgi:hypothetical protein
MSKIALSPNASGTGLFTIASPNSNTNRTLTLPDAAGELFTNAGGTLTGALTGTDLTLSGGVYLGGTGSANLLDDYEEGTFTPAYEGSVSNPTVTYTTDFTGGFYTKIGNRVIIDLEVRTSAISGGSGNLKITGLPFAPISSGANTQGTVTLFRVTFDSDNQYSAEVESTYLVIRGSRLNNSDTILQVSDINNVNPSLIRVSMSYRVS